LPPKQETFTVEVIVTLGDPALGTLTDAVKVHPFTSVIRHVYGPAARPVAVAALPPEGDHAYV
jgi:hypothetical protein